MIRTPLLAALLPAALLAPTVLAQSPTNDAIAAPLPAAIPIHSAPDDPIGGAYGIWAAGNGFKASFHGGFAFHPTHARGTGVALAVASCRVGAHELHEPSHAAAPRWTDWRCEYDHGAFVEAYDVHAHGVEQTFVLAARPAATGDLVIELAVQSRLAPRAAADGGVHFAGDDGAWHVAYGAAVAIDARGERRPMRTELDGTRIRLVCDAAWLERAVWPVTVDPLVQPNPSLTTAPRITGVDVCRDDDETVRNLWIAITLENGSGDRDLIVRRFDAGLANGVDVFVDVTAFWSTDGAQLAASGAGAKVGAVFTRDFGTQRALRWHLHGKD